MGGRRSRRASLSLSFALLVKLAIYGLALIAVFFIMGKLAAPLISLEKDWRSERNLALLALSIEEGRDSVVLHLPEERLLVGFSAGDTLYQLEQGIGWSSIFIGTKGSLGSSLNITRPRSCGSAACLCIMRIKDPGSVAAYTGTLVTEPVLCEKLDVDNVGSTVETFFFVREGASRDVEAPLREYRKETPDGRAYYPVLLDVDNGPRSVLLTRYDNLILLDPVCYDSELEDYRNCKDEPVGRPVQTLDCSANADRSEEAVYCDGRPMSLEREFLSDRIENGKRVCYVCQQVGKGTCAYQDSTQVSPLTKTVIDYCEILDRGEAEVQAPSCDRPEDGQSVFVVEQCNQIYSDPLYVSGPSAGGMYDSGKCGYCTFVRRSGVDYCTLQPWNGCGQEPESIACDSAILHSYLQSACTNRSSPACSAAKQTGARARQICPGVFDATGFEGLEGDATGPYTLAGETHCVLCNAERDTVNPHMTRCTVYDLPTDACG